jgi:p24 family protein alpha
MRKGFSFSILLATILLSISLHASAVYFVFEEGSTKCFIEEIPENTPLRVLYSSVILENGEVKEDQADLKPVGLRVQIFDPIKSKVFDTITPTVNEVRYMPRLGGDFRICFSTNTSHWWPAKNKVLRMDFEFRVGVEAEYEEVARREHVEAIEAAIRRLRRRTADILVDYHYQKMREARFRQTSESTNSRVLWWSIAQIAILVGGGLWQVAYLRRFFTKQDIH